MLLELRVKNLALIEKAEVCFKDGLNILTGETGAGKSIIIGSVNMALGGKASRDMIRQGADSAYVELIFAVDEPEKQKRLRELEVDLLEDGILIISKKITPARSISKINDETVTAGRLKEITSLLIDIHGQHEHQSLLYKSKHLQILDDYAKSRTAPLKEEIAHVFHQYQSLSKKLADMNLDQEGRRREADFCRYEIDELEGACLKEGEEEILSARYRRLQHSQKIMENLSEAYDTMENARIDAALKSVSQAAEYDGELTGIRDQLYDADAIVSDVLHDVRRYMDEFSFDEEEFVRLEERLDLIHNLQAKYGSTIQEILGKLEEKRRRLKELENYDLVKQNTEKEWKACEAQLEELCGKLSDLRRKEAGKLVKRISQGLKDLNFIDVQFSMEFRRLDQYGAGGYDEAEFMISTNPGMPVRPLGMVASGGELSRIMLAIKAVLADTDDIPTLIFDEIDTGISGRTAQKVSEKLSYIAGSHQVICITHLPQIAAMADTHFEIAKEASGGLTTTSIKELDEEQMIAELARLLGGAEITEAVFDNAREMKRLAGAKKG
ncbi:MAG: DNA repair protein RecN [Hungatella sp.]|jgi:DNA repair protein RecN (Recombination protein N)|nr:DNA repair protein RecN [Hungatella sp.]